MAIKKPQKVTVSDDEVTAAGHLTLRQSLFPVFLVTILFFLWGFAYGLLDVLNKVCILFPSIDGKWTNTVTSISKKSFISPELKVQVCRVHTSGSYLSFPNRLFSDPE